ncbi:MAG: alanine dehydrogenase [Anaerolineales bacterium]|nr:alanine dehydrogenase [Anaerolineales bacterium]
MNIGIPKERRPFEYRVSLSPAGVEILCQAGHTCYVEHDAGVGAVFPDQEYERAGARIVYAPDEIFRRADLIVKVSRPMMEEIEWLRPETTLMGLLHLASARQDKIDTLLENRITSIAYEQISDEGGALPVLRSFSQIGGAMAGQLAARLLQTNHGGRGILLGGVPGVPPAEVLIIGGGVVGASATRALLGLGAHVTVIDSKLSVLQRFAIDFPTVVTMISTRRNIARVMSYADVVVGAVLVTGQRAPVVVTREMVKGMKPRSLILDLSIDEGGCVDTSRPTTHEQPTYVEEGVIHCCIPNLPSVVARTAVHAFVNAAMPYILEVANHGADRVIETDPAIQVAVNTYHGELMNLERFTDHLEA